MHSIELKYHLFISNTITIVSSFLASAPTVPHLVLALECEMMAVLAKLLDDFVRIGVTNGERLAVWKFKILSELIYLIVLLNDIIVGKKDPLPLLSRYFQWKKPPNQRLLSRTNGKQELVLSTVYN